MKSRKSLLIKLLQSLVEEWGPDEVFSTLEKVIGQAKHGSHRDLWPVASKTRRSQRFAAMQLVEKLEIQSDVKQPLTILANRFDDKDFLPSVADVREFIIMAGERPPTMKNRQESFRNLLRVLLRLPPDRLRQLAEAAGHSGPAQLGPISDAISAAGERIARRSLDQER